MIVLVCGGRNYADRIHLWDVLEAFETLFGPIAQLIHGGARGADRLAGEWATLRHIPVRQFPAQWDKNGRAAGPLRNQQMLDEGKPDIVVAFPGGAGTADMVRRAHAADIKVIESS